MTGLRTVLGAMALGLSFAGYALTLHRRAGIPPAFVPLCVCAGAILALLAGGLAGALLPALIAVLAVGIGLLVIETAHGGRHNGLWQMLRGLATPGLLCCALVIAAYAVRFAGTRLTQYDDFSHWGTVARYMYGQDRLPDWEAYIIMFQAYPLGSSLFIYCITRVIGFSDASAMLAQMLLLLACGCCPFALLHPAQRPQSAAGQDAPDAPPQAIPADAASPWSHRLGAITLGALWLFLVAVPSGPFTLRVDSLQPAWGVACMAIVLHYRHTPGKAAALLILPLSALMMVKNSAVYFVVAVLCGLLITCIQNARAHKKSMTWRGWAAVALAALVPFALLAVWHAHVAAAFPEGTLSKHAMTAEGFARQLGMKDRREMLDIVRRVLLLCINPVQNAALRNLLIAALATGGVLALLRRSSRTAARALALGLCMAAVGWCTWAVSLAGMYVLSMPPDEAQTLASFSRYAHSGGSFLAAGLLMGCVAAVQSRKILQLRRLAPTVVALVAAVALLAANAGDVAGLVVPPAYAGTPLATLDEMLAAQGITDVYDPQARYEIRLPPGPQDEGYLYFALIYRLQSVWFTMVP